MTFEEKLLFERILQAALAQCQIAVHTDPKFKKDALKEREAKHAKEAKKEALTSSRPVTKSPDDIEEQRIGAFMLSMGLLTEKLHCQSCVTVIGLFKVSHVIILIPFKLLI